MSEPTELPASSGRTPLGVKRLTYSMTLASASATSRPCSHSLISPEWVCILRTKSFIWSTAVWLGLMT